ncbi:hypothetical protein E0F72_10850, partial [Streptococcus dysgalactiae]|uniref:hypothetical protein n=1 Tax=Streptococcus dysgalactiae TaxID=1334 RepID=UPI0012582E0E
MSSSSNCRKENGEKGEERGREKGERNTVSQKQKERKGRERGGKEKKGRRRERKGERKGEESYSIKMNGMKKGEVRRKRGLNYLYTSRRERGERGG